MATIMAGGARRSAAPTYDRVGPRQSMALNTDPEVLRRQIFEEQAVAAPIQQGSLSESFARGTSTLSGQGGDSTFGSGASYGGANPAIGSQIGAIGTGLSALGTLAGNSNLGQVGGMLGLSGALSQASPTQALGMLGTTALGMAGVPSGAVSFGLNALQSNVPGMVNSAISLANPTLAAINALSSVLGFGTVGSMVGTAPSMSSLGVPSVGTGLLGALSGATGIGQLGQAAFGSGASYSGGGYSGGGGLGFGSTGSANLGSMGGGQGVSLGGSGLGLSGSFGESSSGGYGGESGGGFGSGSAGSDYGGGSGGYGSDGSY